MDAGGAHGPIVHGAHTAPDQARVTRPRRRAPACPGHSRCRRVAVRPGRDRQRGGPLRARGLHVPLRPAARGPAGPAARLAAAPRPRPRSWRRRRRLRWRAVSSRLLPGVACSPPPPVAVAHANFGLAVIRNGTRLPNAHHHHHGVDRATSRRGRRLRGRTGTGTRWGRRSHWAMVRASRLRANRPRAGRRARRPRDRQLAAEPTASISFVVHNTTSRCPRGRTARAPRSSRKPT